MQTVPQGDALPRVFLSYSRESDSHVERVQVLADRLRAEGLDVRFNDSQLEQPESLPLWVRQQVDAADFVLVVCTESYRRLFDGGDTLAQKGPVQERTDIQGTLLPRVLVRAGDPRYIPVVFSAEDAAGIPEVLRNATYYVLWEGFEPLYRYLAGHTEVEGPQSGVVRAKPPRSSPEEALTSDRTAISGSPVVSVKPSDQLVVEPTRPWHQGRGGQRLQAGVVLLERYELLQTVGRGGFGTVWRAHDRELGQEVAVKIFQDQHSDDNIRVERFFRGARRMASLDHPGVVRVLAEQLQDDDLHFFVMEYVHSGNLRRAVLEKSVTGEQVLDLIVQVGQALMYAHERGIVHRDVKPSNILLGDEGQPLLTDFDLVRALDTTGGTRTGAMGTFVYAAPEQLSNAKNVGPQADVYGLGMTAVFALYGEDLPAKVIRDIQPVLDGLDCRPEVRGVLARALEWERRDRWGSVREFVEALEAARRGEVVDLPAEVVLAAKEVPRLRMLWRWGAAAAVVVALAAGWWWWFKEPALPQLPPMPMKLIPAGTYVVGSPLDEVGRSDSEWLQQEVRLSKGFWIAETEVTQQQWKALMGTSVPHFRECGEGCPMEQVSWFDAVTFANRLSAREGFELCYEGCKGNPEDDSYSCYESGFRGPCSGFRLPTEVEWEIAARAGSVTPVYSGELTLEGAHNSPELNLIAWYGGNSGVDYAGGWDCSNWEEMADSSQETCGSHEVATKEANAWGLYDMLGNISEWTGDWSGRISPVAEESLDSGGGSERIYRGGSWSDRVIHMRASVRFASSPGLRVSELGFRLARDE